MAVDYIYNSFIPQRTFPLALLERKVPLRMSSSLARRAETLDYLQRKEKNDNVWGLYPYSMLIQNRGLHGVPSPLFTDKTP